MYLYISGGVLALVCVIGAATDIVTGKIYNWLTFPAMLVGLILAGVFTGWMGLLFSFLGIVLGCGLLILGFIWGGIGAGDIKMLMAVGALMGWFFVLFTFVYSVILAAVFALILYIATGRIKYLFKNIKNFFAIVFYKRGQDIPKVKMENSISIRFGVFIALGAIFHFIEVLSGWRLLKF